MKNDKFNKEVGEILQNARNKKGYTQQRLSELSGISRANIAGYETGRQSVPLETFITFCDLLDLDVNTCLKGIKL